MPVDTSYYDLLELSPTCTALEIRKAFRVKALHLHPDRNNNTATATQAFQHLNAVYKILSDPDRRAEYDQFGPPANLHSDDQDFDMSSVAAFFQRKKKVTAEDIQHYESVYRDGPDERDDLTAFYNRMEGNVTLVEAYIPYSDETDFTRFVRYWDEQLDDGKLEQYTVYKKARKTLLRKGKRVERDLNAPQSEAKDDAASSGMADLQRLILQRQQKSKSQFDDWCERIEQESKSKKSSKGKRKSSKRSSSPDLKPRGNIRKKKA